MWNISEIYRSIQGEGLRVGRPSTFLRFAGCPRRCQWLCQKPLARGQTLAAFVECDQSRALTLEGATVVPDSAALWRWFSSIVKPYDDIVLTGGEPTEQSLSQLCESGDWLKFLSPLHVTLETCGANPVALRCVNLLSISPIIMTEDFRQEDMRGVAANVVELIQMNPQAQTQIKFTMAHVDDIKIIKSFINQFYSRLSYTKTATIQLMIMPVSLSPNHYDLLTRQIIDEIILADTGLDVRLCDRLQYRIWKGERGR
jgi:organic radical activating enzyme